MANNSHDPFRSAFDVVVKEFQARLKNDDLFREILQTRSIEEVYNLTDKMQEEQARTGRMRNLSKIGPFLERLRGYAGVIEVFMQAKPDILALLWGPIKLILQWADVLKQSMDAIIDTTAEIGNLIPEFKMSTDLFGQKTAVQEVLVLFFRDILEFYIIALKFFSLPRLAIVFESLWPRQRDKIKVVVSHIQRHAHLLRNEVRLEHIQAEYEFRKNALERFDKAEAAHDRQEYQALRTSFNTSMYEDRLQYLDDRTFHDAGLWLLKHDLFRSWIDRKSSLYPVLWLQGIPGSGKSHLARLVIHNARESGRSIFVFLTHTQARSASAISILRSLVFQISTEDPMLQSIVCRSSGEKFRHSVEAVNDVLKIVLSTAGPVSITVDGLDEIDGAPRCQILKILLQICSEIDHSFINHRTARWYKERQFEPESRKEIETKISRLAEKSKGMFLYSRIVLDTIEFMDADEVLEDLKILPETMNDAYHRILDRINKQPPAEREKARTIIGWIEAAPSPLTVQELEQALMVRKQGPDGMAIVKSKFPIRRMCGPIVEVVDGYVHFVHFTVNEYFLSSHICDAIDGRAARLSLAICCLNYLCQRHHNGGIDCETRNDLILAGAYRLHYFAISYWPSLVQTLFSQCQQGGLPSELVEALGAFRTRREIASDTLNDDQETPRHMKQLQKQYTSFAAMLLASMSFQVNCNTSSFRTIGNVQWSDTDPLDLSVTSCHIAKQMEAILTLEKFDNIAARTCLTRHYGERLYKCRYMFCDFQRQGFDSIASRMSHEAEHEKPWNCDVRGCEFEQGGFLSRNMRDEHMKSFHEPDGGSSKIMVENWSKDDIQRIRLDLVTANDFSRIKHLVSAGMIDVPNHQMADLLTCAAQHASPQLFRLLFFQNPSLPSWQEDLETRERIFVGIIEGNNLRMLEYILQVSWMNWEIKTQNETVFMKNMRSWQEFGISRAMASGNDEMIRTYIRWVKEQLIRDSTSRGFLTNAELITSTAGDAYREQLLLEVWREVPSELWSKTIWKNAILNVASTTCSIVLTEFLVEQGVPVDWRPSQAGITPLAHAARKCSSEGAELVKFLIFQGAETLIEVVKRGKSSLIHISEQKGARQISQWLGVSFDELVAQAERLRRPPESPGFEFILETEQNPQNTPGLEDIEPKAMREDPWDYMKHQTAPDESFLEGFGELGNLFRWEHHIEQAESPQA